MLLLSTSLNNIPLISVRSGARIGTVLAPIINPNNLHIDGFWCETVNSKTNKVLLDTDIRDFSTKAVLIDDHLGLSDPEDLVRLSPIIEIDYTLEGKPIVASKHKIGRVTDFAVDSASMFIQKLYAQPPIWKSSLSGRRLTFDRASVIEVTDTHIEVAGPEEKSTNGLLIRNDATLTNYSASTSLTSEKE